jgi:hypothetical protein
MGVGGSVTDGDLLSADGRRDEAAPCEDKEVYVEAVRRAPVPIFAATYGVLGAALGLPEEGCQAVPLRCAIDPARLRAAAKTRPPEVRPAAPERRLGPVGTRQEFSCASPARTRSDSARTPGVPWNRSSVQRYRAPGCRERRHAVDPHSRKDRAPRTTRAHRPPARPAVPGSSLTWLPSFSLAWRNLRPAEDQIPGRSVDAVRRVDLPGLARPPESAASGQGRQAEE